ncbi:MAG: ATP-binding domain-containing protein [Bacteroidales bacterium]|nr:ATP-binding domain-containing protein [Bacteroidales bacterium]
MSLALIKAKSECSDELIYSLSRTNITSNAMKKEIGGVTLNSKLIEELFESDKPGSGNKYRSKLVIACIKSVEFARENKFKEAIKEMAREFKFKDDPNRSKRESLKHIATLISKYDSYKDESLYHFFTIVKSEIKNEISDLRNGAAKTFYEGHTFQDLALCINIPEDMSYHKTIHKAKGDEFDNVLLVLEEEKDLDFILNPNLNLTTTVGEEHRINYVAVSRAKNRLFISVPTLAADKQTLLAGNFQVDSV